MMLNLKINKTIDMATMPERVPVIYETLSETYHNFSPLWKGKLQ
jgi:hypothetical protein